MSTVTLSKPHCAITSAEKPAGMASQPLITALPEAQICLTLFAIRCVPSKDWLFVWFRHSTRRNSTARNSLRQGCQMQSGSAGSVRDGGIVDADRTRRGHDGGPDVVGQRHAIL